MIANSPSAIPDASFTDSSEQIPSDVVELYARKRRRKQRRFMQVFLLGLILAFSPSKALGLISPLIVLAALIFYVQLRPIYHLQKLMLFGVAYLSFGLFYWLVMPEFWWPNYLLILITFSTAFLLMYDFSRILDARYIAQLGRVTLVVIVLESLYGIFQFILAIATRGYSVSVGDVVWGTLAPLNNPAHAGTSPYFVLLISTLLLFVVAVSPPKLPFSTLVGLCIVALCWLLASLIHSIVYFALAAVMATAFMMLFKPRRRSQRKKKRGGLFVTIVILALTVGGGALVHPDNFRRIQSVIVDATESFGPNSNNGKLRVIYVTIFELPHQILLQPLVGVGPGQYSSRAAMIATGEYLTRASIPLLPDYTSDLTERYVMPAFFASNSSTNSPTSSWLALYGELGMIGWGMLMLLLLLATLRFSLSALTDLPRLGFASLVLVLYLFFMGFQNLYWEYNQGILPGILVLKLCYDFVRYNQRVRVIIAEEQGAKQVVHKPIAQQPALSGNS